MRKHIEQDYLCKFGHAIAALVLATFALAAQAAPPADTWIELDIDPNPATPGADVDLTVNVWRDDAKTLLMNTGGGIIFLHRRIATDPNTSEETHVSCEASGDITWPEIARDPANGNGTDGVLEFTEAAPSSPGSYGYRGNFDNASSGYATNETSCINLVVAGECEDPLSIVVKSVSTGIIAGGFITWTAELEVKACDEFDGVTSQGGINAKQKEGSVVFHESTGSMDLRKSVGGNNQVWVWDIGDLVENDVETLEIEVTKPLPKNYFAECDNPAKYPKYTGLIGSWDVSFVDEFGYKVKMDEAGKVDAVYPDCLP